MKVIEEYAVEPLSIRDHFAMRVLLKTMDMSVTYRDSAEKAYLLADQMMIAREMKVTEETK